MIASHARRAPAVAAVGDALGTENRLPIFGGDFDLVFYGSVVFELRFLCYADELLDVVPFAPEQRGIVRYGVIGRVNGGYAADDCELAVARPLGEFVLQILPRRSRVEPVYFLNVATRRDRLSPVGVKDFGNTTGAVGRCEAAITGFFSQQAHNLCAVLVENKH